MAGPRLFKGALTGVGVAMIATAALAAAPTHLGLPPSALAKQQRLLTHLAPAARAWVTSEAQRLAHGASPNAIAADISHAFPQVRAQPQVNVLTFLALMEASEVLQRQASAAASHGGATSGSNMTPANLAALAAKLAAAGVELTGGVPDEPGPGIGGGGTNTD